VRGGGGEISIIYPSNPLIELHRLQKSHETVMFCGRELKVIEITMCAMDEMKKPESKKQNFKKDFRLMKKTHEGWHVFLMIVGCFLSLAGFALHLRCH
jgi:hypothetical protein